MISWFLLHVVIIKSNFSYFTYKMKLGIGLGREFQLALTGWSNFQHGFEIVVCLANTYFSILSIETETPNIIKVFEYWLFFARKAHWLWCTMLRSWILLNTIANTCSIAKQAMKNKLKINNTEMGFNKKHWITPRVFLKIKIVQLL